MKYLVRAKVSLTTKRVFQCDWDEHFVSYGPYKRLRTAKRKRAELRKHRCETVTEHPDGWRKAADGGWETTDHGPSYTKVWIDEIKEPGK